MLIHMKFFGHEYKGCAAHCLSDIVHTVLNRILRAPHIPVWGVGKVDNNSIVLVSEGETLMYMFMKHIQSLSLYVHIYKPHSLLSL